MIKVIERIEKGTFDLSKFTEEDIDFIKCLVTLGFSEGFEKGEELTSVYGRLIVCTEEYDQKEGRTNRKFICEV